MVNKSGIAEQIISLPKGGLMEYNREYTYDPLYRLISATGRECDNASSPLKIDIKLPTCKDHTKTRSYLRIYEYDNVGNFMNISHKVPAQGITEWTNRYSYGTEIEPEKNNRLRKIKEVKTSQDSINFIFDKNGNLESLANIQHFYWDYADRMKALTYGSSSDFCNSNIHAQYFYDFDGVRVIKVVQCEGVVTITNYIDGIYEDFFRKENSNLKGHATFKHLMDNVTRIVIIKNEIDPSDNENVLSSEMLYHHCDHLGNSQIVTKDDGSFHSQQEYYPFGETSFGSYIQKKYGFCGKERELESGLYYYGSRYFQPKIGKWINADPLFLQPTGGLGSVYGLNLYVYALNSPLVLIDQMGLDVVVYFSGYHGFWETYANKPLPPRKLTTGKMAEEIRQFAKAEKLTDVDVLAYGTSGDIEENIQDTIKFITGNIEKGNTKEGKTSEKIIIYGYSLGGEAAVKLAETLGSSGYTTNLLITVDSYVPANKGNTKEGYLLEGRVGFDITNNKLADRGENWFESYLKNGDYFETLDGKFRLKNCYRYITFMTGENVMPFLHKITYNFIETEAYDPYFASETQKKSSILLEEYNYDNFFDPNFLDNPKMAQKLIFDAKDNLKDAFTLFDIENSASLNYIYLPISNYLLKVFNSFVDESGNSILGKGFKEMEYIFSRLIPLFNDMTTYTDKDNLVFKLFNIDLRADRQTSDLVIQNMGFRSPTKQTRKEWFNLWLNIFQLFDIGYTNNKLDQELYNTIVLGGFKGKHFDLDFSNEYFTKNDIKLARRIEEVLVSLIGRFSFEQMYTGSIFSSSGIIQFMSQPWWNKRLSYRESNYNLLSNTKIPGETAPLNTKAQFLLESYFSAFSFNLPTLDSNLDNSLTVDEVALEFWQPQLYKQNVITAKDIEFFYSFASDQIFQLFKNHEKFIIDEMESNRFFLESLMRLLEDRNTFSKFELFLAYKGLSAKIFTEDYERAWDFRKDCFNWLASRGEYALSLQYEYGKSFFKTIYLTRAEYLNYFDDSKIFGAFNRIRLSETIQDLTKAKVQLMQDSIEKILKFVNVIADTINGKFIIYTFNIYENGLGIDKGSLNYFPDALPSSELEWKLPTAKTYKDIAYVFDPSNPAAFESQLATFISNFIVRPMAFVVRKPGSDYDEFFFAFTPNNCLNPDEVVGHYTTSRPSYGGPPRTGMTWSEGTEAQYKNSHLVKTWNDITKRLTLYPLHYFKDSSIIYALLYSFNWIRDYKF